ncbi:MAG: ATP-binding protein [Clostridia bacterium]|nr:ATP-binding protein [Clostridia bacterium]
MGFNRENYARIKEEYDGKYLRAEAAAKLRRAEIHAALPEIEEIDRKLRLTGLRIFEATMRSDKAELERINQENSSLMAKRAEIMTEAGFAPDYTEIKYECEECGDTGTVDNRMCKCMRKKLIEAGIKSSGMSELIKKQSFENFSLDYYKQNPENYRRMSAILDVMKKYAESFSPETSGNIAMFGGTGLGKTHLSSAVAAVLIENGNDVYYTSATNMFADFEEKRFGSSASYDVTGDVSQYFSCDLLIIDDLGAEMINQFTVSCLYNVINTRINRKKPTMLSTNLTQEEFKKKYWDRISSRVIGEYLVLPFFGEDIRWKRLNK